MAVSRKRVLVAGAALALGVTVSAGAAWAVTSDDDGDVHVTGPEADRATEAALVATGGGEANSVERDSEDGATWEVEVTRLDGSTVDVRLDERFELVVIEDDSETEDDGRE